MYNRAPPSHIKSPICVLVRLPGVAGCTGGQEWVMGFIGSGVLDQSAEIQLVRAQRWWFVKNNCSSETRGTYAPRDTLDFTFDLIMACW